MEYILKTENITKTYSGKNVVDAVNMTIRKGDIYGFIGENGAGKTTLMRMVVGLAKASKGSIELFESNNLDEGRQRTGCVIENPALYPNMTAKQNLEAFRLLKGIEDSTVVDETLKLVGLSDTGKKKVKNFSLGMKQRLSIAIAVLNKPEFLILDEPINGLDPTGIIEVRDLILKLNKENNMTVMVSSHILGELSKVATKYGIIRKGSLVEEFMAEELEEKCKQHIEVEVDDVDKAKAILENNLNIKEFEVNDNTIAIFTDLQRIGEINVTLCKNDVVVSKVSFAGKDLETYFIETMGGAR